MDKNEYNWMYVVLGLKQLKRGLKPFVASQLKEWHSAYIQSLAISLKLDTNANISCSGQTIFPPVIKRNFTPPTQYKCNNHNTKDIKECVTLCPNVACYKIMEEIIRLHRFNKPIWVNTNPNRWTADRSAPWEIAKCFLPTGAFHNTRSFNYIDCAGLLNIIINMRTIATNLKITDRDLKEENDVFSKVSF